MKIPPLLLLLLLFLLRTTAAQKTFDSTESNIPNSPDSVTNFQPSLAVVIGMLAIMFTLTFVLLLYAKFCHRPASAHASGQHQIHDGLHRSRSSAAAAAGLDKTVVESLPFFRFSSLKGTRDGLECAVCLARFEDVEILRLLPKCKHAFHIDCIDQWLDKHATCPLCRRKVAADDLSQLQCSSSLRFLWNPPPEQDSGLELYVEREESHHGSSRFCIGSSFRKADAGGGGKEDEKLPIPPSMDCASPPPPLHRLNHKIVVSDVVLKNRWSNVSSSDIMFLNSEILNDAPQPFPPPEQKAAEEATREREEMKMDIKEEMERKRAFESKVREINGHRSSTSSSSDSNARKLGFESSSSSSLKQNIEKRSMSEIVVHPRFFTDPIRNKDSSSSFDEINVKEERIRRIWLPIATKTVQWFANKHSQELNQQRSNV